MENSGQFKHGHPKAGGRRKGTGNKYRLPSVAELLKKHGVDPVEELILLATKGTPIKVTDPATKEEKTVHVPASLEERRRIWTELLSYTTPKPRPTEPQDLPDPSQAVPEESAPTAQLLSFVKGKEAALAASPVTPPTGGDTSEKPPT